jgi:hypothetical protein
VFASTRSRSPKGGGPGGFSPKEARGWIAKGASAADAIRPPQEGRREEEGRILDHDLGQSNPGRANVEELGQDAMVDRFSRKHRDPDSPLHQKRQDKEHGEACKHD